MTALRDKNTPTRGLRQRRTSVTLEEGLRDLELLTDLIRTKRRESEAEDGW